MKKISFNVVITLFLVSFALIALQLFYMRALSVIRYHHFSYLVISTALLGFGASGTYLTFAYQSITEHFAISARNILFAFTLSIPLSYTLIKVLPLDTRYLLYSADQFFLLIVYNLLVLIPFFFGATFIGMCLRNYRDSIPLLYGVNLFASGLGGLGSLMVMHVLPAETLPLTPVIAGVAALSVWEFPRIGKLRNLHRVFLCTLIGVAGFVLPLESGIDQYKSLAHLRRLEQQDDARKMITCYSPRMRFDVYDAPSLHQTLFAGPLSDETPPPQLHILFDGQITGTLFRIDKPEDAGIMDSTPQSLPYRLLQSAGVPVRALLVGEVGGSNIWLARRYRAEGITVLQPAGCLLESLKGPLHREGGSVFFSEGVETLGTPPRLYMEGVSKKYSIIHIASAEGMPAASSGLQSLHENYVLTSEGIHACLLQLQGQGFVAITRGIQSPPRDNIKVFSMFLSALEQAGVEQPQLHLLQARNYMAVTTLVSAEPISEEMVRHFQNECRRLDMDVEYYPGIQSSDLTQKNRIQGPPGKNYSYYHHAAMELLGPGTEEFYDSWAYNVRPPGDQQPYFHNFFRWSSFGKFIDTFGTGFLRRMELGYIVLVLTFVEICVVAFVLILLPLWVGRSQGVRNAPKGWRLPVFLHFGAIGLGFMFLEMVMIQKLAYFLGDPIYSASAVITSILVCAGIGSSLQDILPWTARRRIRAASVLVVLLALGNLSTFGLLLDFFIEYSIVIRFLVALVVLAPIAFCMGWMLPAGMQLIRGPTPDLIPWAWGINGFTSVAAGPLAVMLSIAVGFPGVILCAAACYTLAGFTTLLWPEE